MPNATAALANELESALAKGSPDHRANTLRRITDLFLAASSDYTDEQIELFDDVIGRLAETIEFSARVLLAERLAPVPNAPPRLIKLLALDDSIDVARSVLRLSDQLGDDILINTAETKSQDHLLAISRRRAISEAVTEILVHRGDQEVVQSTAENAGARFSENGFVKLVERSAGDDRLAYCVGSRRDMPAQIFAKLVTLASDQVRDKLKTRHPHMAFAIDHAITASTEDIQAVAHRKLGHYAQARARVEALHAAGQLDEAALEAFASSDQFEETALSLSLLCDLPLTAIERAMSLDRPETMIIFGRAIGLSWPTTREILRLCVGPHGLTPKDLESNFQNFERLKVATAKSALRFHRLRDGFNAALH